MLKARSTSYGSFEAYLEAADTVLWATIGVAVYTSSVRSATARPSQNGFKTSSEIASIVCASLTWRSLLTGCLLVLLNTFHVSPKQTQIKLTSSSDRPELVCLFVRRLEERS